LAYFDKLQRRFRGDVADPKLNPDDAVRPVPILVEKILERDERLPTSWPVDGTTGYDFGASVSGLWANPAAEDPLTTVYRRFTGDARTFADHVYDCKQRILQDSLASELNMLARQLHRIAASSRRWRDFTLIALTRAIRETLAAFPVYRTYLREDGSLCEEDIRRVRSAIEGARVRNSALDLSIFSFLEEVLLLRVPCSDEEKRALISFALRFQQLTGPVMAKAVEDTAFYRYGRLLTLNEVGGDPGRFGTSIEQFHAQNLDRIRSWPLTMVATSTHDSKRGEDAAARIAVLSEMPAEWQKTVARWSRTAERYKRNVGVRTRTAPSSRDEYIFYQALIGAWPFDWDGRQERAPFAARMAAFMDKVAKEAKLDTSWIRPDFGYDRALQVFVDGVMSDDLFMADVSRFSQRIATYAASNGMAQTLLKLCSPGVPDTYQGSELWNQSLVDPDNRRPVEFALRQKLLEEVTAGLGRPKELAADLLRRFTDGGIKLLVTHLALRTRARLRDLFLHGDYTPLVGGEHVVAFARSHASGRLIVVVPRLPFTLTGGTAPWAVGAAWGAQTLAIPHGKYRDVFTGRAHPGSLSTRLGDLLLDFPLALLVDEQSGPR
jgi:(1->4)-alpha-D-glucan 1-alpha-D-glucosylmutase